MKIRSLSLIIASLAGAVATTLADPIASYVTATASLTPGSTVTNSDSSIGAQNSLSAASYTSTGPNSVFAVSNTFGVAADGNSGSVLLQTTWDLVAGTTFAYTEGTRWDYTFTADATGNFVLNYNMNLTGSSTFGLNGVQMAYDFGNTYFSATGGSGQFIASVLAGQTYRVALAMNANLSGGELVGYDGTLVGLFDWSLPGAATVPETTSTIGLLLVSFAGLAGLRRKLVRA